MSNADANSQRPAQLAGPGRQVLPAMKFFGALLLHFVAVAHCFVVPTTFHSIVFSPKTCNSALMNPGKLRTSLPRMAMDEAELDRKLRELAAERKQSLDQVMGDNDMSAKRIQEARSARIEEESVDRARVSGSAEAASRGRNPEDIVASPSFLEQAVNSATTQERERAAAAASPARPKSSMEGLEIDPRGFIVPKVLSPPSLPPHLAPGLTGTRPLIHAASAPSLFDPPLSRALANPGGRHRPLPRQVGQPRHGRPGHGHTGEP